MKRKTKKDYDRINREAERIVQSDPALAATIALAWTKKHNYLFLSKDENTALEKSGGWNLAMQYKMRGVNKS